MVVAESRPGVDARENPLEQIVQIGRFNKIRRYIAATQMDALVEDHSRYLVGGVVSEGVPCFFMLYTVGRNGKFALSGRGRVGRQVELRRPCTVFRVVGVSPIRRVPSAERRCCIV